MNYKKKILTILCIFTLLGSLFAQTSDNWYYDKEIVDIDFIGLKAVSFGDVDSVVSEFIGQTFTDEVYAEILNRIYALEYFDDIIPLAIPADPERETCILEFTVLERPVIESIHFSGNKEIKSHDLRDKISIKENDIYTESKIAVEERIIRDYYYSKGFTKIDISSKTTDTENGKKIIFYINEGRSTVISSINFQGNSVASDKTLKKNLQLKEVGIFEKGAFQENILEKDKQIILYYYQTKGYINAKIKDIVRNITYNEEKDRDEIALTFVIDEGKEHLFNGLTITGNVVFSTEELLSLVTLKKGDVYNQILFQENLAAIADKYYENGYTANGFYPQVSFEDDNLVSCTLTIIENSRSHIESISIVGNNKTKDEVILREIPLQTGDIFSKTKMETGLRSLFNMQYFSAVVPEILQGSESDLVDVVLNVEEKSTTSIEFGVTFAGIVDPTSWPVSLFAKWSDTNFLGTGRQISADIKGSTDEQSISVGFTDPWFLDKPLSFNANFYIKHLTASTPYNNYLPGGVVSNQYYMNYNQLSFGLNLGLGKRWVWDNGILTVSSGLSTAFLQNFYDGNLYEPVDSVISDRYGKFGVENTLSAKIAFDARDLSYDPGRGYFISEQVSWTGLIPKFESEYFLKADTRGELYFTLADIPVTEIWNFKLVLAMNSSLGFVFPGIDSKLSDTNMYRIDGMFNGRGWSASATNDQAYDVTGSAFWSNTIELRWPIAPGVLSADFFFDTVAIKDTPKDMFTNLTGDDFYFSFGPGLRFSIPQFPLRLMWAWSFKLDNGQFQWNSQNNNRGAFVLSFNITQS